MAGECIFSLCAVPLGEREAPAGTTALMNNNASGDLGDAYFAKVGASRSHVVALIYFPPRQGEPQKAKKQKTKDDTLESWHHVGRRVGSPAQTFHEL